jgi:hypothetical protein
MNGTLTMMTSMTSTLTQGPSLGVVLPAVAKVVLLLGYPAGVPKKTELVSVKKWHDVPPPPRWGLNE